MNRTRQDRSAAQAASGHWRWWPAVGAVRCEPAGRGALFPLSGDLRIEQWLQCVQPMDRRRLLARLRAIGESGAAMPLRFRAVDGRGHERWVHGEARCEVDAAGAACILAELERRDEEDAQATAAFSPSPGSSAPASPARR